MAQQSDFTPEEWKTLTAAPMMAGMYVTLSQLSGPIGLVEESYGIAKEVLQGTHSPNELVKAVAGAARTSGGHLLPAMPGDRQKARALLLDGVRTAMSAVGGKAASDAEPYGQWVYAVAQRAAAAAKEGGFLGFGGTAVSDAEKTALADLASALGLPPASAASATPSRS